VAGRACGVTGRARPGGCLPPGWLLPVATGPILPARFRLTRPLTWGFGDGRVFAPWEWPSDVCAERGCGSACRAGHEGLGQMVPGAAGADSAHVAGRAAPGRHRQSLLHLEGSSVVPVHAVAVDVGEQAELARVAHGARVGGLGSQVSGGPEEPGVGVA